MCKIWTIRYECHHKITVKRSPCAGHKRFEGSSHPACLSYPDLRLRASGSCGPCQQKAAEKRFDYESGVIDKYFEDLEGSDQDAESVAQREVMHAELEQRRQRMRKGFPRGNWRAPNRPVIEQFRPTFWMKSNRTRSYKLSPLANELKREDVIVDDTFDAPWAWNFNTSDETTGAADVWTPEAESMDEGFCEGETGDVLDLQDDENNVDEDGDSLMGDSSEDDDWFDKPDKEDPASETDGQPRTDEQTQCEDIEMMIEQHDTDSIQQGEPDAEDTFWSMDTTPDPDTLVSTKDNNLQPYNTEDSASVSTATSTDLFPVDHDGFDSPTKDSTLDFSSNTPLTQSTDSTIRSQAESTEKRLPFSFCSTRKVTPDQDLKLHQAQALSPQPTNYSNDTTSSKQSPPRIFTDRDPNFSMAPSNQAAACLMESDSGVNFLIGKRPEQAGQWQWSRGDASPKKKKVRGIGWEAIRL